MVKWLFWWPNSEIWKVSNLELKVSNYSIKRFTFDYKENLYVLGKTLVIEKTCMIGNYLHYDVQKKHILNIFCKDSFYLD